MCGIVSVHTSGKSLDYLNIHFQKMISKINHRGPDAEGFLHIENQAMFGHKRLAIIDLDGGNQPMISDNGRYSLIYNGEIYNYLELRQELLQSGNSFKTYSDTEVLIKILIKYGEKGISKLNGMFAFVFYDKLKKKWLAARDHFGIKPLYYSYINDELIFASEIKSILAHPHIKPEINKKGLQQYLAFQFCLKKITLFKNIFKIEPGQFLIGEGSKIINKVTYWEPNYEINNTQKESFFIDKLQFLIEDSIRLQIRSDVPLGGYLSGGLDSSLVCSLASEILNKPFPTFHGRFLESPLYDESKYAKKLIETSNCLYNEVIPSAEDFVNYMPKIINMLDEPIAGPGVFPQYCVSKLAKNKVKVVLGGQGGDELFGGYARYLIGYLEQAIKGVIFETNEEGEHLVTLESIIPQLTLLKQYKPLISQFFKKGLFEDMDKRYFHLIDRRSNLESFVNKDYLSQLSEEEILSEFQEIFNHSKTSSYINKMTYFDQKTLLPSLLQIEDRVSMSVSLESRVPILDFRIANLVASMPPGFKFQGGKPKNILKKAIKSFVPNEILHRKDKMGFPVPLSEWMQKGPVREFVCDTLLSKKSINRGIFREEAIKKTIDNTGVGGRMLWGMLCLELWNRQFIDV